jgi:hypothetical protein
LSFRLDGERQATTAVESGVDDQDARGSASLHVFGSFRSRGIGLRFEKILAIISISVRIFSWYGATGYGVPIALGRTGMNPPIFGVPLSETETQL